LVLTQIVFCGLFLTNKVASIDLVYLRAYKFILLNAVRCEAEHW